MIKNTFVFLPGISEGKEKELWRGGINDWNDFLAARSIKGISDEKKKLFDEIVRDAKKRLFLEDIGYLAKLIPHQYHWRMYDHFKEESFFLDIETFDNNRDITVVGLYNGLDTKMFVRGINFFKEDFLRTMGECNMMITFNGLSFDIPKLQKHFSCNFNIPHIDLRYVCSKIGLKNGLKSIEKELGIERPEEVKVMDGNNAVELWKCWKATGEEKFLELLIKYNEEDIVNLKQVADYAIPRLWEKVRRIEAQQ
jgi:uncharacterized protein